jgi:hypothetical protein
MRALGRRLCRDHPDCTTLAQCGLPIGGQEDGPGLLLTEAGRMVGGQLVACRSPLRCAWCSPMQWQLAEQEGAEYLRRHQAAGGWIVHSALTVPHRKLDSLDLVTGQLFGSWRRLKDQRLFRAARRRAKVLTAITVLQILWSKEHGWHPHLHVAWLCVGDPADADWFGDQVRVAWRINAEKVTGRRTSPRSAHSELVFTSLGFWKYCKPDDPLHPKNDCRHPKHKGCPKCRAPKDDPLGDQDPLDGDRGPEPGPGRWDGPMDPGGPLDPSGPLGDGPLEVFSQVAPAAHRGNTQALAVFTEYLTSLANRRRIPSGFQHVRRLYGPVDMPDPWSTPGEGGARVWIHPQLAALLELHQRQGSPTLGDVIELAVSDPIGAAAVAEMHLDEPVAVERHTEDGCPILGRPSDLAEHPSAARSQADQPTTRSNAMRNTNSSPADDGRRRILEMTLDQAENEKHRKELLGAVVDSDSRAKSTRDLRAAAGDLHEAVIDFGDDALQSRWETVIVQQMAEMGGIQGPLLKMALEINDARQGKTVAPKPVAAVEDDGEAADDGSVEEGAAAA